MTYREKIQDMISQLRSVYTDSDWMRDHATQDEKEYWNQFRMAMQGVTLPLQRLDNSITDSRGAVPID